MSDLKMNQLDRMIADNQTGMRMKQAQQLLKVAAEVALLAATSGASGALGKAGASVSKAAGAGAKAGTGLVKERLGEGMKKGLAKVPNMLGKAALEQGKNKGVNEIKNKIKEQLPDGTLTALERAESLYKSATNTKNILETFKQIKSPHDANGIVNTVASVVLGEKDLTHGGIGYAPKVLNGTAPSPSAEKAKEAVAKMTELENQTNTVVEKNLNILKAAGIKALPGKITIRKKNWCYGQQALMNTKVPANILKNTEWLKNKAEFLALRKDIAYLGPQAVAIKRGTFDIAKEITTLEKIEEDQKALVEQVKTIIDHDGKTVSISDPASEKFMNKECLTSLNLTNGEAAYKNVEAYQALGLKKNLLTEDLQTQLTKGEEHLDQMIGQTTRDLLNDTRKLLEATEKDEEEKEEEERSEETIKKMREA